MKIKNPFIAFSVIIIVLGVILSFILLATSADERSDKSETVQLIAQANPEMKLPPMMRKRLEKLGVSIEDFQNNPEKRAKVFELMKKAQEARGMRPRRRGAGSSRGGNAQKSDGEFEYYKTIVDNNLFRPLGWGPKKEENPFALRATIMPSPNFPGESKAIIWVRAGNKERIVTIGDTVGGAIVKRITDDSVTLEKDGKPIELSTGGMVFLNASGGGGRKGRGGGKQPQAKRSSRRTAPGDMRKRFKQMSPEEKRRIAEEMRRRRESRRGRPFRSGRRGSPAGGGRPYIRSDVRMRRR